MSLFHASVPQMKKMLTSLERWLDKAVEHAKARSLDPENFVQARLAPDQYPLVKQIQGACDAAKFAAARLTGKEAPKHPDTETTLPQLRERIRAVVAYLDGFAEADFAGAGDKLLELPFLEGKVVRGGDYFNEMANPNFYFHVVTAYAILRHNGVDLGKRDFIGSMNTRDK